MSQAPETIVLRPEAPASPGAQAVLAAYFGELVSRYHDRPATPEEVTESLAAEPSADLEPPTGRFWLAQAGPQAVGCVGLRLVTRGVGEVTRMFVAGAARRQGLGSRLLEQVEAEARQLGLGLLRLDSRHDLVEALHLYAAHGYQDVPAFNASSYADRWMAKVLA